MRKHEHAVEVEESVGRDGGCKGGKMISRRAGAASRGRGGPDTRYGITSVYIELVVTVEGLRRIS